MSRLPDSVARACGAASDETAWESLNDDRILLQRRCPDCDHGLLSAPARFHGACGGSGYLVRVVDAPTMTADEGGAR